MSREVSANGYALSLHFAREWGTDPSARRHELALKRAADPIDHPGADRFRARGSQTRSRPSGGADRARRIERRGEGHEHVEFEIAQAEQGNPLPRWRGAR